MILLDKSVQRHYFFVAVQKIPDPHPTRGLTLTHSRVSEAGSRQSSPESLVGKHQASEAIYSERVRYYAHLPD